MYSVYAYDKQKSSEELQDKDVMRSFLVHEKIKANRGKLCDSYSRRISDFIMHMKNHPTKINNYQSPLECTERPSDPLKFKGKPRIVVREYKTHRERLLESMSYASIHRPNPEYDNDYKKTLKVTKSTNEIHKRMYFKPKNNLERVIDVLKSRHVDITEYEPLKNKKHKKKTNVKHKKGQISGPDLDVFKQAQSDGESEILGDEEIPPKKIFAGLHNKTYFKGVTSMLIGTDSNVKMKSKIEEIAKIVLRNCNVRGKTCEKFLKIGEGKLVSNPEESVRDTYEKLKESMKSI
ncbi:hypothetical protein SteCoe_20470 [Stentor coeruleus]|uniref:Uncharacterized protein n=1 Tax=Stentor coeruleus TaxID=5963 RepID=A0A1R2BSE7_9CILI|nr:hypothetical protein SteCoe_20470 [Stentor coeruleus]